MAGAIEPNAARRLVAEKDVFAHGAVGQEAQFLMDDADAGPPRRDGMGEGDGSPPIRIVPASGW